MVYPQFAYTVSDRSDVTRTAELETVYPRKYFWRGLEYPAGPSTSQRIHPFS